MSGKAMFAALPVRAISDTRLSALHLRVLACIAFHDRMSGARGKGQGAWASNETLARRVQCHYTSFSTAVTELGQFGYLQKSPHPLNKRLRVFRVIYDTGEALGDPLPNDKVLSRGVKPQRGAPSEPSSRIVGRSAKDQGQIVCPASEKAQSDQPVEPVEYISLSDERYSAEAGKDIPHKWRVAKAPRAPDSGLQLSEGEPAHESLAKFERAFKRDRTLFTANIDAWQAWLENIAKSLTDTDSAAAYRAQRLAGEAAEWADHVAWERSPDPEAEDLTADALRDPVAKFWAGANRVGKAKLAGDVGLTASEVDQYVRGLSTLPIAKCAALRSACARI